MAKLPPEQRTACEGMNLEERAAFIKRLLNRRSDIRPDTTLALIGAARGEDDAAIDPASELRD